MNSNWNHSISLISYKKTKDSEGFDVAEEIISNPIPANYKSVN